WGSLLVSDRVIGAGSHGGTRGTVVDRSSGTRNPDGRAQRVYAGTAQGADGHPEGVRADVGRARLSRGARGFLRRQEKAMGADQLDELVEVFLGQRFSEALLERPGDGRGIVAAVELAEQEVLLLAKGEAGTTARVLDHVQPLLTRRAQQQVGSAWW